MTLALEILGLWIGASFLAAALGLPRFLKRRFDRHDDFVREVQRHARRTPQF